MSQQSSSLLRRNTLATTLPAASSRRAHPAGCITPSNATNQHSVHPYHYYSSPHHMGQFRPSLAVARSVGTSGSPPSIQTFQGKGTSVSVVRQVGTSREQDRRHNPLNHSQPVHSHHPRTSSSRDLLQNPTDASSQSMTNSGKGKQEPARTQLLKNLLQKHKRADHEYLMETGQRGGKQWHRAIFRFAGQDLVVSGECPSGPKARGEAARRAYPIVFSMLGPPMNTT